jgi:hypothetical protein
MLKSESELEIKKAYWSGVFYALDPERRGVSEKTARLWTTAHIWITAIDWTLGRATNSATMVGEKRDDSKYWDT